MRFGLVQEFSFAFEVKQRFVTIHYWAVQFTLYQTLSKSDDSGTGLALMDSIPPKSPLKLEKSLKPGHGAQPHFNPVYEKSSDLLLYLGQISGT